MSRASSVASPWRIELRGRLRSRGPLDRRLIDVAVTPWGRVNLRGTLALDGDDTEWVARSMLPESARCHARVRHSTLVRGVFRRARWAYVFDVPGGGPGDDAIPG